MVTCTGNFCSFKEVVPCFQDAVVALGAIFCGLCGVNVGAIQGGLQGGGVPQVLAVPLRAPAGGVGHGWDQLAELAVTVHEEPREHWLGTGNVATGSSPPRQPPRWG